MKSIEYVFLGLIIFIFIIFNAYSYTASYSGDTPSNGSQSPFNLSIEVDIGGSEDVSSFLLWDNSLLGYWNFENGDSTHVFDYSEFKRNGSYVNGAYITTGGIRGNRSFFDGTNDRIQIPASTSINRVFENGGTISFWAYADNYGSTDLSYLISNYDSLQHTFIIWIKNWVGTQPNAIQLTAGYETSNAYWIAHDSFYTGTWNHVVVRYNSSSTSNDPDIFVNNVLQTIDTEVTGSGSISREDSNRLSFGGRPNDLNRQFDGKLDEVMIFDRLLQDSEIDALYNSQANNFAVNFTGLDNESFYDFQVCSINTTGFYSCLDKIYLINETIISEEILENNFTRVFPAFSIVSGILTLSITLFGIVFLF